MMILNNWFIKLWYNLSMRDRELQPLYLLLGYQHKVVSSTISKMIVKSLIAEISSLRLAQAPPTQTEVSLCKTINNIQVTLYPKKHQ